jgi:hypothetical protein
MRPSANRLHPRSESVGNGRSAWRRLQSLSEEQGFGALHWGKREIPNFWIL